MKIVIVASVFAPEPLVSAQANAHIAEALARDGHSVHVFAPFPNRPAAKLFPGFRRRLYSTSLSPEGYNLTRCFSTISRRSTMISRLAENFTFGFALIPRLLFKQRPDVIYSHAWPIFATGIVALIAKLRRIPLVLRVVDVYPESMESQKRISKDGLMYRVLRKVDGMISRSAKAMIFISPGFQRLYATDRGIEESRLHVVLYWNSDEAFEPNPDGARELRKKLGIAPEAFVATCAGNIGVACNAEMLIDVFAKLTEHKELYLVIAGGGSRLEVCRQQATEKKVERVVIHSPWRAEETGALLQMTDVFLLPTNRDQSSYSIPSKLIGYFLSARPVIAAVLRQSDTAAVINESASGWVVSPDDVDALARALVEASHQPERLRNEMGSAGRAFALRHFTKLSNLPRVIQVITDAANEGGTGAAPASVQQS